MGRASNATNLQPNAPAHWPASVAYITVPVASPHLPAALHALYCTPAPPPSAPPPALRLKLITDPKHPACGQYGLFNGPKKLKGGTWIRDYVGEVHEAREERLDSDYDLSLVRGVVGVDAAVRGNEGRMVNDYRSVANKPNAVFETRTFPVQTKTGVKEGVRMSIWAGPEGVDKGEELLVSYGKGFWQARREAEMGEEVDEGGRVEEGEEVDGREVARKNVEDGKKRKKVGGKEHKGDAQKCR